MKLSLATSALLIIITASCTSEPKTKTGDSTSVIAVDTTFTAATPKEVGPNCYIYTKNRDTATLELNIAGEELTGLLAYKFFEKDSNTGKIAGELKGDTIIAEYIFDSEGLRSVREVIFVKKDDGNIYEGTGEVIEKQGKMVFKDRSALKFNPTMMFVKTSCK